jgi:hypothetical protein
MTGAWKAGLAFSNATSIGAQLASTFGLTVTGSSSTFTKGAWTQVIAATATNIAWVMVMGQTEASSGTAFALDLGTGAGGSEVAIVNNLNFSSTQSGGVCYLLPLQIGVGTRIAARVSSNAASDNFHFTLTTFQDSALSCGVGSAIDTYGFNTATNLGAAVDPGGTINTKGAYTQITASTTNNLAGFIVYMDGQNTTTGSAGNLDWFFDIAVGASGSEQIIVPNLYQVGFCNPDQVLFIPMNVYLPIQIGAGTRISARSQCLSNASPDRLLGITIYGVRQ